MVAENAVMPSAASRSERIVFSFVQLLAGRVAPKNSIRFSPGEQLFFGAIPATWVTRVDFGVPAAFPERGNFGNVGCPVLSVLIESAP
jgi:hypothetical protein